MQPRTAAVHVDYRKAQQRGVDQKIQPVLLTLNFDLSAQK